jgi:hypothetical protein
MFSFTAYLYSAANLKSVEGGLYNPEVSITIVIVYQLACLVAFFLAFLVLRVRRQRRGMLEPGALIALQRYSEVFIVFGLFVTALGTLAADHTIAALVSDLQLFLWLGAALHLQKNGRFKLDALGILLVCLFAVLALYGNSRTLILSCFLIVGTGYFYYSHRLLNLKTIVVGYLAINSLLLFSAVSLDIRLNGGRESGTSMAQLYAEKLLTVESLSAVVNPFTQHSSTINLRRAADDSAGGDFWLPYYGTGNSLGDRFVVLPMMDVVCGQYGEVSHIRWDSLFNLVAASLPSFGQDKNLLYNDQLTWDMGLRDEGVIGKPMLTNACELYTMAGWTGMFLVTTLEFFLIFLMIAFLRKQLVFYILFLGTVAVLLVQITATTSSLGTAAQVIRGFPFYWFVVWSIKQIIVPVLRRAGTPPLTSRHGY